MFSPEAGDIQLHKILPFPRNFDILKAEAKAGLQLTLEYLLCSCSYQALEI